MASFFDIGILENFSIIFVFLLIFAVLYAILEKVSLFGKDKKGINALIALFIAFILILSNDAVLMINFMTPWFVVLFLFIFLSLFALKMFGFSDSDATALLKSEKFFPYIIIILIIIIVAGFSHSFGQKLLERGTQENDDSKDSEVVLPGDVAGTSTQTDSFSQNLLNTLIHPKVLGMIVIMLIGMFTIIFLTKLN